MKRILFQGDSITDAGRSREPGKDHSLGAGYATRVAGKLALDYPGEYEFLNRGVGGERIVDIYARIKADIINLKPDYMSMMVGVNDCYRDINVKQNNGVSAEKYEMIYDMMISEIKEALPDIKIMLIEPYLMIDAWAPTNENGESLYGAWRAEVEKRGQAAKRIAQKHNLVFLPLQEKIDKLVQIQPTSYWSGDGVHPYYGLNEFISREWVKYFLEYLR